MKLIGRDKLTHFKQKHGDVRSQVDAWEAEVKLARWSSFHDVRKKYGSASYVPEGMVVFNLKGNKYRLRVIVNYAFGIVVVDRIGTHDEYMDW